MEKARLPCEKMALGLGTIEQHPEPRARQHILMAMCALPYLGVGVLDTVIHKHHDEDCDGHPKVPNHPPYLWASAMLRPEASSHPLQPVAPASLRPPAHTPGQGRTGCS